MNWYKAEEPEQQSPFKHALLTVSLDTRKGGWENGMSTQNDNIFSSMTATLNEPKTEEINKLESTLWKASNRTGQKKPNQIVLDKIETIVLQKLYLYFNINPKVINIFY